MIKKLITLFKLGRKVAKSDILDITSKFQKPPLPIKILFKISTEIDFSIENFIFNILYFMNKEDIALNKFE